MKTLFRAAALAVALCFIAVSCQKDEILPNTEPTDSSVNLRGPTCIEGVLIAPGGLTAIDLDAPETYSQWGDLADVAFNSKPLAMPYAYLITDDDGVIMKVSRSNHLNVDQIREMPLGTYRIWSFSYMGTVDAKPGQNANTAALASLCYQLTSNYITVLHGAPAENYLGPFLDQWENVDPNTGGITRVVIEEEAPDNVSVHMWGACSPTWCDWGAVFTTVADAEDGVLEITWDQGFVIRQQTLSITDDGLLKVVSESDYQDSRPDRTNTYYFYRAEDGPPVQDNTFTDPRDGQVYQTVVLADGRTWMAENLNYKGEGDFWDANSWWYGNSPSYGELYGRLYTWDAAMQACPDGWKVATKNEWDNMIDQYDEAWTPSQDLYSVTAFQNLVSPEFGGNGTSGFNVLPGGNRYSPGGTTGWFGYLGVRGVFWSGTEIDSERAWLYNFAQDYDNGVVFRNWIYSYKRLGLSCRCIKED